MAAMGVFSNEEKVARKKWASELRNGADRKIKKVAQRQAPRSDAHNHGGPAAITPGVRCENPALFDGRGTGRELTLGHCPHGRQRKHESRYFVRRRVLLRLETLAPTLPLESLFCFGLQGPRRNVQFLGRRTLALMV